MYLSTPSGVQAAPEASTAESDGASDTDEQERARRKAQRRFEQGMALYNDGESKAALVEFELAYELLPNPELFFNIGVIKLELQDYAGAYEALRRFLDEVEPEKIDPKREDQILQQLESLEDKVGTIAINVAPSGSTVRINGNVVGTTPIDVVQNVGYAQIEVERDGFETRRERILVVARKEVEMIGELDDVAEPEPVILSTATKTDSIDDRTNKRLLIGTWVTLGLAGASGAAAIVTGVLAQRDQNDLEDLLGSVPADPLAATREREDLQDRVETLSMATDIGIGVAAASAATSLGLGIAVLVRRQRLESASERDTARVRLDPAPGGFRLIF